MIRVLNKLQTRPITNTQTHKPSNPLRVTVPPITLGWLLIAHSVAIAASVSMGISLWRNGTDLSTLVLRSALVFVGTLICMLISRFAWSR